MIESLWLPGNEPEFDEDTTKKALFESFPEKWQRDYLKSGRRYTNDSVEEIVPYMNLVKGTADEDDEKGGSKRKGEDRNNNPRCIRGGGAPGGRNGNGGRSQGRGDFMMPDGPCKVANHHGHKWSECSLNPRSNNFRMYRGGHGGSGGGRGGDRFGGGRFGGRGNNDGRRGASGGRPCISAMKHQTSHRGLEFPIRKTYRVLFRRSIERPQYLPFPKHRIVGRFGRDLTPGNSFNGCNSKSQHKSTEVVLTKFMVMERDTCGAFFEYAHLIWNDVVLHEGEGPLWNGEDIFMSLVANHIYGEPDDGRKFNNYAMDWLNVWQADDSLKDYSNGKLDISGGMKGYSIWDWRWWQTVLRRNRHYSYRGMLWQTARKRLRELQ